MQNELRHSTSFRDPGGSLLEWEGRILRTLTPEGTRQIQKTLQSAVIQKYTEQNRWIRTQFLDSAGTALEHPRIFFPSYSYEWAPEMLYEAGKLTLDLAEELLTEGFGLKDASSSNILFEGSTPVFVDVLSVETRDSLDMTWKAFGQFARNFINPLIGVKYFKQPLASIFLRSADGLQPKEIYRMSSWLRRFSPTLFPLVTVPTWCEQWMTHKIMPDRKATDPRESVFVLKTLFMQLRRALEKVNTQKISESAWSRYEKKEVSYSSHQRECKNRFIREYLLKNKPASVLDVGCNTGRFSKFAAHCGSKVVAIDSDETAVRKLWRDSHASKLDLLPLQVDICTPSPAVGWRNAQTLSFVERARGRFDCIFALAVMHHVSSAHQIPLKEFLGLLAEMSTKDVIFEFIGPEDGLFKAMTSGRNHLRQSQQEFEALCVQYFEIVSQVKVPESDRTLYHLCKKR